VALCSDVATETAKRLLARIKRLRESLELSQEAFAERAGLDYKYYQHIEAGRKQNLTMDILTKLASGCGMELSELFDFDHEPMAVAEDPPAGESRPGSGKGQRKTGRRRAIP